VLRAANNAYNDKRTRHIGVATISGSGLRGNIARPSYASTTEMARVVTPTSNSHVHVSSASIPILWKYTTER
jgi:hypothetical protein